MCKECNGEKEIKEKKVRKVFLDELPRKYGFGNYQGQLLIDWENSIDYVIKFIYDNIQGEIKIIDYNKELKCLYIKYLDNDIFRIYTSSFIKGRLGKLLSKEIYKFKLEIGDIIQDNKRDLIITDRKYEKKIDKNGWNKNLKYYKYKCNKCGFNSGEHYKNGVYQEEHWIEEDNLLNGNGCACCCSNPRITVSGINDIATTNPELIKYFQNFNETKIYTYRSHHEIYPICPICNQVKNKSIKISTIYQEKSIGCPKCSDGVSYPEKLMYLVLKELNIDFIYQLTKKDFKWCNNYRYDFYFKLNNKEYIIETDGGLGHGNNDNLMNGITKEESKYIDNYKDQLAKEYNIEVIRIDCKESNLEYIKDKILHSQLNRLFDLSKVDWLRCEEFALSSLVKEICLFKTNNIQLSTLEISKIFKLSRPTIIRYLKQGAKLGWCNYNPKEEMKKGASILGKKAGKLVEIFNEYGFSLEIFESCTKLEKESKELFGVRLDRHSVADVCNGIKSNYKNYTFKYIN